MTALSKKKAPSKAKTSPVRRVTGELPRKDADVLSVAQAVSGKWSATPAVTLAWMSAAAFAELVAQYATMFGAKRSASGVRPSQTYNLRVLDARIAEATTAVKIYVNAREGTLRSTALYARFGMVREAKMYRLPQDRQNRLAALRVMAEAVEAEGFGAKAYGTAFWTGMAADYEAALDAATTTDGAISGSAARKNVAKAEILKVMKALMWVLRGNYPDTYRLKWREWGWQKEDY